MDDRKGATIRRPNNQEKTMNYKNKPTLPPKAKRFYFDPITGFWSMEYENELFRFLKRDAESGQVDSGAFTAKLRASAPKAKRVKKGSDPVFAIDRDAETKRQAWNRMESAIKGNARRYMGIYGRRRFAESFGFQSAHSDFDRLAASHDAEVEGSPRYVVSQWQDEDDAAQDAILHYLEGRKKGVYSDDGFFPVSFSAAEWIGRGYRLRRARAAKRIDSPASERYAPSMDSVRFDLNDAIGGLAKEARKIAKLALVEGDTEAALQYLKEQGYASLASRYRRIAEVRATLAAKLADLRPVPEPKERMPRALLEAASTDADSRTSATFDRFTRFTIKARRKQGRTK
jgi:hypothetical protein